MKMKKGKSRGRQISVSPEAHEVMSTKAFNAKPRGNLREVINELNDLPKDL